MPEKSGQQGAKEKEIRTGRGFTATAVYAAFGFLTALISFVFLVNPAWRPDPRERQIAELTTAAVDVGIPFGAYLKRAGDVVTRDEKALCIPGNVVYVEVSLQGFKHRDTTLRWVTMDKSTHKRVDESRGDVGLRGAAPSDQGIFPVWVQWPLPDPAGKPLPDPAGTYFIRFMLFSDSDMLALVDEPTFRVTQSGYVDSYNQCLSVVRDGKPIEGNGPVEVSLGGGGGGFDVGRWLLYAALAVTAGLLAALAFHGTTGLLRRRRQE